jgi:hypothetical protein
VRPDLVAQPGGGEDRFHDRIDAQGLAVGHRQGDVDPQVTEAPSAVRVGVVAAYQAPTGDIVALAVGLEQSERPLLCPASVVKCKDRTWVTVLLVGMTLNSRPRLLRHQRVQLRGPGLALPHDLAHAQEAGGPNWFRTWASTLARHRPVRGDPPPAQACLDELLQGVVENLRDLQVAAASAQAVIELRMPAALLAGQPAWEVQIQMQSAEREETTPEPGINTPLEVARQSK